MKPLIYTLLFLSLVLSPTYSRATVADGTMISPDVITPLAEWVAQTTHVPIDAMPVVMASGQVLKTALGLEGTQQARALAAYLPGQIIINNIIWEDDSLISQSYIIHELVHHTQLLSGVEYPCHEAKEREAYTMQNLWLIQHGEDPLVTDEWIEKISTCSSNEKLVMN